MQPVDFHLPFNRLLVHSLAGRHLAVSVARWSLFATGPPLARLPDAHYAQAIILCTEPKRPSRRTTIWLGPNLGDRMLTCRRARRVKPRNRVRSKAATRQEHPRDAPSCPMLHRKQSTELVIKTRVFTVKKY